MLYDKILQRYPSPDLKRWVDLRQQPDGLYYVQEFSATPAGVPEYGAQSNASSGLRSGTYKSLAAAQTELQSMAPWLSAKSI